MNKFSTLSYLINSYHDGKKEVETLQKIEFEELEMDEYGFEPSQGCVDTILSYALQLDVVKSGSVGYIELNLN